MRSIQRQIGLGLAVSLLLAGLLLVQGSLWLFDQGLRRYLVADLRDEAQSLLLAAVRTSDGLQLESRMLDPSFQRPFSGRYFLVAVDGQRWRSRSLWDRELSMPERAGLQAELLDGPRGQLLLAYRGDYRRLGHEFSILVAQDYGPLLDSLAQVRWIGWGLGALLLALLLLLQGWVVRRGMSPLERLRRQLARWQDGERVELEGQAVRELRPLVEQIDQLLAHTEATLERSRNSLGDLGHALKTPLAVLFTLLERAELRAHPELQAALRDQLEQIQQRLARELGRARLAGEVLPGAQFICGQEVPALLDTLRLVHPQGVRLEWQGPAELRLPFDREDVLELLGNLLDNACKWARGQVLLRIEAQADGFCLQVEDDGPGIAAGEREQALGRGQRLDERVEGHGLGLAIVRDIAASWNAELSLDESPLGGLRVTLRWRRAPRRG